MSLRTAIWSARPRLRLVLAMSVIIAFGWLGVWLSPAGVRGCGGPEKETRYLVSNLVAQHARWSMNNTHRRCPAYIDELLEHAHLDEPDDAWGTRLEMVCESPLGGFGIVSAGADLRFRTADDIHSWEVRP